MSTDLTTSRDCQWQPCFVDPWRGVAHFDGLTIEADPITSARPNRVLPCIEDEQVLFCRTFRAILQAEDIAAAGKTAIDLGTGSGVFALYAAKLRMNVTGVDCCQRSIQFADYNERMARKHDPAMGACQFTQVRHWNDLLTTSSDPADFVFLNAPFSPQASSVILPKCAHGGLLGQDAFRSALPLAHGLLREEGRLFAVQLLLTDSRGRPQIDLVAETGSHQKWSRIRIFPILDTPTIPASDFLRQQYRSFDRQAVLNPADAEGKYFSYVFIEFTKDPGSAVSPRIDINCKLPLQNVPSWTWPERASWHRAVFENTLSPCSVSQSHSRGKHPNRTRFPGLSFFLRRTHAPQAATEPLLVAKAGSANVHSLTSPQAVIDEWMRLNHLFETGSSETRFDCVMVEAAPWHLAQRRLARPTETALWVASEPKSGSSDTRRHLERAIERILREIKRINAENRSIFNHPDLRPDPENSRLWQPAATSQIIVHLLDPLSPESPLLKASNPLPADEAPSKLLSIHNSEQSTAVSFLHPLEGLNVHFENNTEAPYDDCLDAALHAYTAILRQEHLLPADKQCSCYFIALPLPIPEPRSLDGSSGTLYVYAWSSQTWSPEDQTVIDDLGRMASFVYEEHYSDAAKTQIAKIQRDSLKLISSHEVSTLIGTISGNISSKYADLVRDYLSLHLEFGFGPTFSAIAESLEQQSAKCLSLLADCGYLFYTLLNTEDIVPESFEQEDMLEIIKNGRETIQIKDWTPNVSPASNRDMQASSSWILHSIAGTIAALRNTIAHTRKGGSDCAIELSIVESGYLQITNSYTNSKNEEEDSAGFHEKARSDRAGTARVLHYHEEMINASLDPTAQPNAGIKRQNFEELSANRFRHTWVTTVRFPLEDPSR